MVKLCIKTLNIIVTFILLNETVILCEKHPPVFTQDYYRSTYAPNNPPEETYEEWSVSDIPNPPFILPVDLPLRQNKSTISYLTNIVKMQKGKSDAVTVRCPFGWHPVGPFCTTLSVVPPYTQCPMDLQRFEIGPGNPVIPSTNNPGICHRHEYIGLSLQCPQGFKLLGHKTEQPTVISEKSSRSSSILCEMKDIVPYSVKNQVEPLFDHRLIESFLTDFLRDRSQFCSNGFVPREGGCFALKHLPPEPSCPSDFDLRSFVYNTYSMYGTQRLECSRKKLIKGKLWCPEGYFLSGETFPGYPFGAILDSNQSTVSTPLFKLSSEGKSLLENGFLHYSGFKALDSVFCFQVLVSLWTSCNQLECMNPTLRHLNRVLINWGYLLETDPDFIVYLGIPSGRDFRFTNSGARKKNA